MFKAVKVPNHLCKYSKQMTYFCKDQEIVTRMAYPSVVTSVGFKTYSYLSTEHFNVSFKDMLYRLDNKRLNVCMYKL